MTVIPVTDVPFSHEAEAAVLGGCLFDPQALTLVSNLVSADDFFILRHKLIYEAMTRIAARGEKVDWITLPDELMARKQLEDIGGRAYLTQLSASCPDTTSIETYATLVRRAAVRRLALKLSDDIRSTALNLALATEDVIAAYDKGAAQLHGMGIGERKRTFADMVEAFYDRLDEMMNSPETAMGIPSGIRELDQILFGAHRSDLLIFAGRPGIGKTSFLVNWLLNAAKLGARVLLFTMEMGEEQIIQRIVSTETGIDLQRLRLGKLTPEEWSRFVTASARLQDLPITIDDTPALNIQTLRAKAMREHAENGVDFIMVDYLQKMTGGSAYAGTQSQRTVEIGNSVRGLKDLAKELNVPVMSAAQLNRAVEQRQNKRPQLSDLRESGEIEQEADVIMFLHREDYYEDQDAHHANGRNAVSASEILIEKHRNGPTGIVNVNFNRACTKFGV